MTSAAVSTVLGVRAASGGYEVEIGAGLVELVGARVDALLGGGLTSGRQRAFVVTSPEIDRLWGARLEAGFPAPARGGLTRLMVPAGEEHKRLATVERLVEELAGLGADRDSVLVALGGGVIGDMTGFVAAMYMRGIRYVGVPTTALAQIDSSLGGKTGVNLAAGKNLVGAFHHPLAVYSDIATLGTLPAAELRAGLQEAVKAGIIRDRGLFEFLESESVGIVGGEGGIQGSIHSGAKGAPAVEMTSVGAAKGAPAVEMTSVGAAKGGPAVEMTGSLGARRQELLRRVVVDSVRVKAEVVSADEREGGLRMILNLGHTLGHAIEAATGYKQLLHGEAVAWGMLAAAAISKRRGLMTVAEHDRVERVIVMYGPLKRFEADAAQLVALTAKDKKNRSGDRKFVLPRGIGDAVVVNDVTVDELTFTAERMMAMVARQGVR